MTRPLSFMLIICLDMQGVAQSLERRFLETFALGRVRMDRTSDIFERRTHL